MGRGQRHDVVYVNIDAHRGWRLHDYHREAIARGEPNWPDPRPGWDRLHPDYGAWLSNLAAEQIDFLFVARPDPADGRFNIADRGGYPVERQWADAHPEAFTLVYGPADGEPIARIYRVHPPGASRAAPQAIEQIHVGMGCFLDRDSVNTEAAPALDISLQVGLAQPLEREFLAEVGEKMVETDAVGVKPALHATCPPRRQVAIGNRRRNEDRSAGVS